MDRRPEGALLIGALICTVSCGSSAGHDPQQARDSDQTTLSASPVPLQSAQLGVEGEIPNGYVFTPKGYVHKSCVHQVPSGAAMDRNNNIVVNGTVVEHDPPCAYPVIPTKWSGASAAGATGGGDASPPSVDGWVEDSYQASGSVGVYNDIENFVQVPYAPTNNGGQLVYLFPALEPTSHDVIIQPVLQYGVSPAGGGNWFGLAAWWWATNNNYYASNLISVNPGDVIYNEMYIVEQYHDAAGLWWYWEIYGLDETTGQSVSANLWTQENMTNAWPAVLEAHTLNSCNEYPSSDESYFYSGALFVPGSGGVMTYKEIPYNPTNYVNSVPLQCGYQVNSNPSHGSTTLFY